MRIWENQNNIPSIAATQDGLREFVEYGFGCSETGEEAEEYAATDPLENYINIDD